MTPKPRIVSAAIASIVGIAILCGLGVWQLQRLSWKENLIAEIAERLARQPVALEGLVLDAQSDFTKVTVSGAFLDGANLFVLTTFEKSAGYHVVTPLHTSGNRAILVDRGVIPAAAREDFELEKPLGEVQLTGLLRISRDQPGYFTPANDKQAEAWYWWDVPAMLSASPLPPGTEAVPVTLQLLPDAATQEFPRPQPPTINLGNNHLQYAVTWFGFAVVLAVVTILFIRQQMKKSVA